VAFLLVLFVLEAMVHDAVSQRPSGVRKGRTIEVKFKMHKKLMTFFEL